MKRIAVAVLAVSLMFGATACNTLQDAAKVMKTYRISLKGFQDTEISLHDAGFISTAKHLHIEGDIEKLANLGAYTDKAILASDKATALQDVNNALDVLTEIETNDVTAIGDVTKRGLIEVALAGVKNIVTQVALALGKKVL